MKEKGSDVMAGQNNRKVVKKGKPARTPELREEQLIARAVNLAEKQILEETASSQIIVHFLRLGTEKAKLEREKLKHENELLRAKTEAIESSKKQADLYKQAIDAMKQYSGNDSYD